MVGENVKKLYMCIIIVLGIFIGLMFSGGNILIALGAVAFVAATLMVLKNYEIATYILSAYALIDFVLRGYVTAFASIWDEAFLLGLILLWIFKWLVYRKEEPLKQAPMDLPIVIYISVMLLVLIVNSPDFSISLEGFRANVQYVFWYFAVLQLTKGKDSARRLSVVFTLIVGAMAIHGVWQYIIGVEMPAGWVDQNEAGVRTRVYSILTSPNIFGSLLTLAMPITVALGLSTKSSKRKAIFFFLALMMVGSLVFTFSRGAWIGFMVAVACYVLLRDVRLIIPVIIGAVLVVILVPSVGDRITYMLSPEYIESSLKGGRLVRWITGLRILEFNPVFGVGLGHFGGAVAMNHSLSLVVDTFVVKTFYMDNYYLKTAVETGITGLAAFVMLMYQVFINSLRTIKITSDKETKELAVGIMAGLCGVIVHNFVENVFEVPLMSSMFWLFVAVMMGIWYNSFYSKSEI